MLKKPASSLLASFRPSMYPRGYALGPSLAVALLDELFEHPEGVFSSCPRRVGYRSSAVPKWFSRSPLGVEQVLYRYPDRAEPCFSSRLCPEKLDRLIHLPTVSHKIERRGVAKKRLTDWVYLGTAAEETVDPVHSILSVDAE